MSATNATTNYSLPLFIGTDKPAWLVDWNGAMTDIDAQMKVNATAILANETAISGLSTTVSAHTTSISTISGQISTLTTGLNTAQGNINTINSLIGNGEPTTSDKTLIGAINEIYGMITGGGGTEIQAANVSYDNTTSGLVATSVQAAIDEVYAAIPGASTPTAADVSYSNTTSGLTATNVQNAIDEINAKAGVTLSATEHAVGSDINGDIIYEKTYRDSGSWNSEHVIDSNFTPSSVKKIVSIDGAIELSSGTIGNPMIGSSGGTTTFALFDIPSTGLQIAISGMTVASYTVTVRYTKN